LRFDINKFRYYDLDSNNPNQHSNIYAQEKHEIKKPIAELKSFSESYHTLNNQNLPF